jgi:DNA topoisomerase-1
MQLVIVESPTKGNTIQNFLGSEYKVLSSYGHVRDLPEDEFGIDLKNNFKPKYVIIPKAKKIIRILKVESQKATSTILATDEDREGEAIAYHLTRALNLKNPKRIVFHEITKSAIEAAFKNPREINLNLVDAQQARRILDRIVGYKLSPFLWKKIVRGLSAGRVQSVAVRLVAEREKEIQDFIPQEYWTVAAQLKKTGNGSLLISRRPGLRQFDAILVKKDGKAIPKFGIKTKKDADEIVKDMDGAEYKVVDIEKKESKRNPLPPFTTSTLQQGAWLKFKFPAKFTMSIAQKLYEKGFITYHRTDSLNLSDSSLLAAKNFIINQYGQNYWAGFLKRYKTKGRAQEAHEAIRPTYPEREPDKLKVDEKLDEKQFRLYNLIWRRFIACQMNQALFDATTVDILATKYKIPDAKYTFRATGQVLKFDGFLKIYPIKFEETELPLLKKEEILELIKLIPSQHFTQPPSRYTEATLIKILEEYGIGRPSTYAPILSTIQERNYVKKDENKKFQPTEIGTLVNDLLVEHFPKVVDVGFTAKMEESLDEISQGKEKWVPVIKEFYEPFIENLKSKEKEVPKKNLTKETKEKCPECGNPLVIRISKYGKFYACSKFPKCRYKKDIPETIGVKCPKCKGGEIILKKIRAGKFFYGCSNYPKCN